MKSVPGWLLLKPNKGGSAGIDCKVLRQVLAWMQPYLTDHFIKLVRPLVACLACAPLR
jgi:hypothetical protein